MLSPRARGDTGPRRHTHAVQPAAAKGQLADHRLVLIEMAGAGGQLGRMQRNGDEIIQ